MSAITYLRKNAKAADVVAAIDKQVSALYADAREIRARNDSHLWENQCSMNNLNTRASELSQINDHIARLTKTSRGGHHA